MPCTTIRDLVGVGGTESADRKGDVVFVHGLDGHAEASWSAGEGKFWPLWLAEDCPDVGVWSVRYNAASSEWKGTSLPLFDRAVNILELLTVHGLGDRPLCFIAHSMGGLVVKKLLQEASESREYNRFARMTRGVLFLATPHTGSDLARLENFLKFFLLRPTTSVHELRAREPQLRDLNIWYRDHVEELGIRNKVYFETQQTKRLRVVDEVAADPGIPRVMPIPIDADHVTICKPASRQEIVYLGARQFVRDALVRPPPINNLVVPRLAPPVPVGFVERAEGQWLVEMLAGAVSGGRAAVSVTSTTIVHGAGGFGKTSLVAWACGQQAVHELFPDGTLWAQLGQDPGEQRLIDIVCDLVTAIVGRRPPAYATVQAAAGELGSALADRRILLVVDDVWSRSDLGPFLQGGNRCVRLVTTRRPGVLDPSVQRLIIDRMAAREAVTLLGAGLSGADNMSLMPLFERSGRWPLAPGLLT
jgi:hypothetical protein